MMTPNFQNSEYPIKLSDDDKKLIDKLKYLTCSLRERLLLFHFLKTHPEVNISQYSSWSAYTIYDAILTSGSTIDKLVEVKFREFRSKQFDTTFIEPKKFHALRLLADESDYPIEFWNFYSKDGRIEIYDLRNVEWFETEKKRIGKDCFDSLQDDESTVIELDKSFAYYIDYDRTINYDQLAREEAARRMPDKKELINTLNLSKFQSYLNRKNNKK